MLLIDFYKVGHINQYPKGITQVWSNWTARSSRVPGSNTVVNFGLTAFIKSCLFDAFEDQFFQKPIKDIIKEYRSVIGTGLGLTDIRTDHIEALHRRGELPLKIYSLPEGASVPLNVPALIVTNTDPEFFWLPNYFETILSASLWKPSTSATTARRYREVFLRHARRSGETDFGFVNWMGHDFSFRGMSGLEDAVLSGMGHLTCFSGTDTVPAILAANKYYSAGLSVGGSVPATEHSVMCAGGKESELATFRRLLTEVYPSGIVSIVSDTWDLWKVLTEYVPALKEEIMERQGKLVIRPDSGDPVKIICGDPGSDRVNEAAGVLRLLARELGTHSNGTGLPMINSAGAIYGDSITVQRAEEIVRLMVDELHLSPYNMVFGIGSYTYEYVTRDTYNWAMKATAYRDADGTIVPIFKRPVTDDGAKFSHKGLLAAYEGFNGYYVKEGVTETELNNCAYQVAYVDGKLIQDPSFEIIRARVQEGL